MFESVEQIERSSDSDLSGLFVFCCLILLLVGIPLGVLTLYGVGSTDPTAKRVLEDQGYSEIVITGGRVSGCGGAGIGPITGFTAVSTSTGREVSGQVCTTASGKHYVEVD